MFKGMFAHDMKESLAGEVALPDLKAATFKQVLHFIYTGDFRVQEDLSLLEELLNVADRFQIPDLVELCSVKLAKKIGASTLAALYILGDKCNADTLKKACLSYIKADPARLSGVMDSEGFKNMSHHQIQEIVTGVVPKRKAEDQGQGVDDKGKGAKRQKV